jgi:adenylate kinase family enzyme
MENRNKRLKRIYILGTSGSGKSFLGKILSNELKIPFYDSDDIMFIKKFTKSRSKEKRKLMIDKIAKRTKWIIDGRGSIWSREPMKKSDLIIWLQPNSLTRAYRILKRYSNRKGENDEDLKSLFRVLKYSLSYKFNNKVSGFKVHKEFFKENRLKPLIIKNNRQLNDFLRKL